MTEKINKMAYILLTNRRDWEDKLSRIRSSLEQLARKLGLDPETITINDNLVEYLAYNNLGGAGLLIPPYALVFLPARLKSLDASMEQEKLRVFISGNLMRQTTLLLWLPTTTILIYRILKPGNH